MSRGPTFSEGYKRWVLALLVMAYSFNIIDRTVIVIVGQAIKVDMKLTDTQLGLMGGLAFAILYTTLGLPVARAAERWNRVSIISLAMVAWSGFTVACGFAGNFLQLVALRVGVGMGEAGLSPPAFSLISDYYPPARRASALSIYALGAAIGTAIGAAAGGWVAKTFGWRAAFLAVGAPGVLAALLVKLFIREPPRGLNDPSVPSSDGKDAIGPPEPSGWAREMGEFASVTRSLFGHAPVRHMVLGVTISSIATYGLAQFAPPYFIRAFGLDYATVGLVFGLSGGLSSGVGILAGGFLADWAGRRDARWRAMIPAIGLTVAAMLYLAAYTQRDWRIAALVLLTPGLFHLTTLGPTFGVVQNIVEARRRATATAVLLLFMTLISAGGGPIFTGWVIDHLAAFHFAHAHASSGGFAASCPAGVARAGAQAALVGQCKGALIQATREGLIITLGFLVWGAIHYLLAAPGLAAQMATAAAPRPSR